MTVAGIADTGFVLTAEKNWRLINMNIETGVPIPVTTRAAYGENLGTIRSMKVGDSIYFDDPKKAKSFSYSARRVGCKTALKTEGSGARVWLTEKADENEKV